MSGFADSLTVSVLVPQITEVERDFCECAFSCEYVEKAFAGSSAYEADQSSFLYKKFRSADIIVLKIEKDGDYVATITDDTYGTYYPAFTAQPLYLGLVLDWTTVFNAFGGGKYRVVAEKTILGVSSVDYSRYFRLNAFDDFSANNTVKLEITQSSNVLSSPFDFTNLVAGGWVSKYRIPARFSNKVPELNTDSYLSSNRTNLGVQPSTTYNYSLKTQLIPSIIADMLNSEAVLANRVLITDYNLLTPRQYIDFPVFPVSIEEPIEADNKEIYTIVFTDEKANTLRKD